MTRRRVWTRLLLRTTTSPTARFAILMLLILVVPALCKRFRLPAVVGLLACGVLLGPSGLRLCCVMAGPATT